jgi:beta-mannosidase
MLKQFILIFFFASVLYSQPVEKYFLNENWLFTEMGKGNWLPASVPGTVHTDLLNNKIIEDPYFGNNEKKLQWIDEKDWEYRTNFSIEEKTFSKQNIEIIFDGLDTYAKVYLNDSLIIIANNMFRSWQVNCKNILKKENNKLYIQFFSPVRTSDSLASLSNLILPGGNQVYIRKAPYHFGWDWGPRFVTSGIWRPVYILAWNDLKIEDVSFQQKNVTSEQAELHVPYFLNCYSKDLYKISIKDISNNITYAEKSDSLFEGFNLDAFDFNLYNPRLWWTRELGTPEIYAFRFEVRKDNNVVDEKIYYIGIRKIEFVREKDSIGESFYFKLNGVPLFIKGANYIPQDNFLTRVKKEKYELLARDCNLSHINMLRVWGGGVYEDDEFYNQCDYNGILVWQDFMFACAMYPGDSAFLKNIKIEASQNISRLKNHPCIALWCGNNEVDEGWNNWGWQKQFGYSKKDSAKIWNDYKIIFDKILPDALENISPSSNYISTSPKFGWGHPESMKEGDSHYWGVWWRQQSFNIYKEKIPRFMSEYGFQGFPDLKTINEFTNVQDRYLYSDALMNHQKHPVGFNTIQNYLTREYNVPKNFEDFVYVSQLLQAYGMRTAIETHRRAKPYCMGTMYWQLNDCWPVVSWSGIDYFGRWKALQYFVKDAYNEILVSPVEENDSIKIYIVSDKLYQLNGIVHLQLIDFSGSILWQKDTTAIIPANSSGVYFRINKNELVQNFNKNSIILFAKLELLSGAVYKNYLYFALPKELNLSEPEITIDIKNEGKGITLNITSDKLVKNLFLYSDEDIYFSENYFDIIPGNTETVYCTTNLSKEEFEKKLKYIYLTK